MAKAYLAKRLAPSAIAITFATAAYAQTQLVPVTYPDLPQLAPAQAIGAVVWLHGRSLDTEDSQAPTPPYIGILRRAGWAPYRFNRLTADDLLSSSTDRLVDQIDQLKRQGYRRIALAGQSFGGFIALGAAAETPKVDAVIATAPAAFGDFSDSSTPGGSTRRAYIRCSSGSPGPRSCCFSFTATISTQAGAANEPIKSSAAAQFPTPSSTSHDR